MNREEARRRREQRAALALMTDRDLAACLGRAVAENDVVAYRAAWHEASIVRGAAGIPRR